MHLNNSLLSEPLGTALASLDASSQRTTEMLLGINMKKILLTRGMVALVDDCDYELVSRYKWYADKAKKTFYASTFINHNKHYRMHRLILGLTDPNIKVDHENGNGLDNTRKNICQTDSTFNCMNSCKKYRNGKKPTSRFKGVFRENDGRWISYVNYKGKRTYCGFNFVSEIEAARARDAKAVELWGKERALRGRCLNFKEEWL